MAGLFLQVAELSVSAAWMIPAVCALRLLLRRAPRWGLCLLWLPVGLRLVWPFSFGSALSLIPRAASHAPGAVLSGGAGAQGADAAGSVSGIAPAAEALEPLGLTNVLAALWLAGLAAMLLYAFLSWLRLRLLVREAVPAGDGKYICDRLRDPFILGLFRPCIYLPSDLSEPELSCVLAHEGAHLRRRDHIWKPLGWLLLSVHWFNPLVWLAYALFCRDVEYACDESVVGGLDADGRRAYARALGAHRGRRGLRRAGRVLPDRAETSRARAAGGPEPFGIRRRHTVRRADDIADGLRGHGQRAGLLAQLRRHSGFQRRPVPPLGG